MRRPGLQLAAIILLATALRLLFLGHKSFWLDEVFSVYLARQSWPEFVRALTEREANSGLYFLLLRLWLPLGDGEFAVRALSVIPSVAAVPVLYALGRRLFDTRTALVGALLLTLNASHIRYAQEARGYSLVVFLVTLATLLLVRLLQRPTRADWLGYVLSGTLAVYAHFFGVLVLMAHAVSLVSLRRRDVPWRRLLAAALAMGVLCVPLVLFLARGDEGQIAWVKAPDAWSVLQVLWVLAGIGAEVTIYLALACIALGAGWRAWRARGSSFEVWRFALLGAWLVVPLFVALALSSFKPILVDRYLLVSLPAFVLLAAAGLERLPAGWNGRGPALAGLVVLAVSGIVLYHTAFHKEDWRGATRYLIEEGRPGDGLLFYPPYVRRPFDYYVARLPAPASGKPQRESAAIVYPVDYSGVLPDSALVAGLAEGRVRVWLVLSHVSFRGQDRALVQWLDERLTREFASPDTTRFQDIRVLLYSR
jgi:mannosyltransferase